MTVTPVGFKEPYGLELPLEQDFRTRASPVDHFSASDPAVNALSDIRVHGIDGDGHVGDPRIQEFLQVICQGKAVGGQAEQQVREPGFQEAQGLQGFHGIGQGVPRAGDARHLDPRFLFQDFFHVNARLGR